MPSWDALNNPTNQAAPTTKRTHDESPPINPTQPSQPENTQLTKSQTGQDAIFDGPNSASLQPTTTQPNPTQRKTNIMKLKPPKPDQKPTKLRLRRPKTNMKQTTEKITPFLLKTDQVENSLKPPLIPTDIVTVKTALEIRGGLSLQSTHTVESPGHPNITQVSTSRGQISNKTFSNPLTAGPTQAKPDLAPIVNSSKKFIHTKLKSNNLDGIKQVKQKHGRF